MTLDYQLSMGISGWFYADIEYPASLSLSLSAVTARHCLPRSLLLHGAKTNEEHTDVPTFQ